MPTTAGGLPYPADTETVFTGDDAIKALADAIQARTSGHRILSGQSIVTTNSSGGWSITFPGAAFKAGSSPHVIAQDGGATGTSIVGLGTQTPQNSSAIVGVARFLQNGAVVVSSAVRISWIAKGDNP